MGETESHRAEATGTADGECARSGSVSDIQNHAEKSLKITNAEGNGR